MLQPLKSVKYIINIPTTNTPIFFSISISHSARNFNDRFSNINYLFSVYFQNLLSDLLPIYVLPIIIMNYYYYYMCKVTHNNNY